MIYAPLRRAWRGWLPRHPFGGGQNRGRDLGVRGAAADVPAHPFPHHRLIGRVALRDAGDRRHDLTGGAVSALEGVVVDEGLLHGVKRAAWARESFDGGHVMPVT